MIHLYEQWKVVRILKKKRRYYTFMLYGENNHIKLIEDSLNKNAFSHIERVFLVTDVEKRYNNSFVKKCWLN